ncbi:MAG: gliding motility-associated C-terminal domain-containing protein [Chitinophagales bacterium]|nr:gliding motility-associated C-terminal domain-containing protein [Chitinophagales bacterium]
MKKRYLLMSLFALFSMMLTANKASASHAAGAEIIYVHISDSTYQYFFKFYRDCTGIPEPSSVQLCFYNTCTNQSFNINMNKWTGTLPPDNRPNGSSVSAGCSQYSNKCDNSSSNVPGYREWWYSCIATLPLKCNYWKFGVSISARNNQTNIIPGNLYVETAFNSSFTWVNSSPYYSVKPIPYVCLNQAYTYNNGALDADGDSLWSQMINPLGAGSCVGTPSNASLVTLTPPINFTNNPLQSNNSFSLNGANGQMAFTATLQGAATLTMKTREFRKNGNNFSEIGSIMRDIQVQVLPCSTIAPTLDTVSINDSGVFSNGFVYGCVGQNLNFCFVIKSTDTGAVLLAEDNLLTAIPGAALTYTNLKTDSVRGCFSWTPTINDVGKHSFLVIIKDSTCKPPGILLQYAKTVDLQIWGPVEASPDTSICYGEPAFLGVTGGANYQWTVLSGTDPSLSNPNIPNPVATPKVTTTYLATSTINPYCPTFNKDTVVITVLNGPTMSGQPDDTTCPGVTLPLDLGIVKSPGVTYNVKWTPATGLSSATSDKPDAKLKTTTQYTVEVGSSDNRCKTLDTVLIDVLTGLTLDNHDTQICVGQSVDVLGKMDARYNIVWNSKTDGAATYNPSNDIVTTITPGDTGNHTYVITGDYYKCKNVPLGAPNGDTSAEFVINVQPNPTVSVDDDASMCYGDTMQLTAVVSPDSYHDYIYSWAPGEALDFTDRTNPIFSAITEGTTTLKFIAKTPAGCSDSDEVSLNVFSATFLFLPNDTAICPGDTISIDMNVASGTKFYWLPDFNISSVSSMQPRIWPVADQQYSVYGVDSLGCLDTAHISITVRPRAVIDMPDSITIYPGESYQMDPGGNCLYYTWFPPLGLNNADISNPSVSPKVNTRYIVHGRTEAGCMVTDSLDVIVNNDSYLTMPNAFTPGKRTNGTLKIVRRGIADLKSFAVYNRWGAKVFETKDINEGWDGTYNGEIQPMGVYLYTIEAVTPSGQTFRKQGNVTLIR